MRWLIALLGMVVLGLGAWLLLGLRAPRPTAEPPRTATPTVSAPPERATREPAPVPRPAEEASPSPTAPPPPERAHELTAEDYRARLDRARRELEHFRAVLAAHPRDEGEARSAEQRARELERQIHADETRLDQMAPR